MKGISVLRDTSPHAFGMKLPAIEASQADNVTRRKAEYGSTELRRAILRYEMKHHPEAQLRIARP